MSVDFDVRDNRRFRTDEQAFPEILLWIMHLYSVQKRQFDCKMPQLLIIFLKSCNGMDYLWILFLIRCLDTHSDCTH